MAKAIPQVALQEFFRWERQSWVEVVADITTDEKAYFIPVESLRSYFTGNGGRKLNKILSEVFECEESPVDPEVILRGHTAVFCILLRISKGKLIEEFAYFEELSDQRLPFDPAHPPAHFPEDVDDPHFLQRFCETQWMYCVPVFDSHMLHKYFGRQRLLPITQKQTIKGEGSVAKYRIKLYGPYNKLIPTGSDARINSSDPNTFMLKRYVSKEDYRQEVKNFSSSKHAESIIRFHGSYTHGNDYNVLLEFADKGSLEDYFQRQTPPCRGAEIIKFWDSLFRLIKAVKAIHSFSGFAANPAQRHSLANLSSGHQDIRPSNVLVLSYGAELAFDWQFKLAHFGVSHTTSKSTTHGDTVGDENRSPQTYVAPECYISNSEENEIQKRSSKTTQAADIWSLGCIYSEAAVWIAEGYSGVADYRRQRIAEIEKSPRSTGGDSFHDGGRVLKTVLKTHREIELHLRRCDNITKDVLDSLVEEMLWEEDRPGAKALWRRAEGLLSRARQKLPSSTTEGPAARSLSNTDRSRAYPAPPLPPPERPLPERPLVSTSRSNSTQRSNSGQRPSSASRQSPANIEMWRTLVRVPSRDLASSVYGGEARTNPESISEHDTDVASSTSGWHTGGKRESLVSSITSPHSSPHTSSHFDLPRQVPNEVRRGPPRKQRSSSLQKPSRRPYTQSTTTSNSEVSDDALGEPSSAQLYAQYIQGSVSTAFTENNGGWSAASSNTGLLNRGAQPTSGSHATPTTNQTLQSLPSTYITPVSNQMTQQALMPYPTSMLDETIQNNTTLAGLHFPQRSLQKKSQGLSLFPTRVNNNPPIARVIDTQRHQDSAPFEKPEKRSESNPNGSVANSLMKQYNQSPSIDSSFGNISASHDRPMTRSDSVSTRSISTVPTSQYESYQSLGYLSLAAVIDWKKAHKTSKKKARIPPVRGTNLLDRCNDRDHVFIIDDGNSMREQWSQVKTAFEALSYILKPMAPDGIELYFTNSYDTWRRHNTSELVDLLEKKGLGGETDISHRLNLQLQDYMFNWNSSLRIARKKAKKIRPISFYVLTNGLWNEKSDPTKSIKEMADYLLKTGLSKGHLTIQFVSFGQNAEALHRMNQVANTDFGLDLVDTTPSTGDVLKMLCGPLDKNYFQGDGTLLGAASSASTLILPLTLPPIELA